MPTRSPEAPLQPAPPPFIAATLGCFVAMVAVDFLCHAVLLSQWWRITASFWRPPTQLFAFIPYAYASFGLYAAGLTWLLIRLKGNRVQVRAAAVAGAVVGTLVGSAGILATYSAVVLPPSALLVFPVSFAAVLASGAAASGLVLPATRPWRRVVLVLAVSFLLVVMGVILQNLLFPTPRGRHTGPAVKSTGGAQTPNRALQRTRLRSPLSFKTLGSGSHG